MFREPHNRDGSRSKRLFSVGFESHRRHLR
nr:MAG TPA: hypothetical protein [Caudoviricetes sp.]